MQLFIHKICKTSPPAPLGLRLGSTWFDFAHQPSLTCHRSVQAGEGIKKPPKIQAASLFCKEYYFLLKH